MQKQVIFIDISQDNLQQVGIEKLRKYDILANELAMLYKCKKARIIPYVMTWDGVVTKYHKKYLPELEVSPTIEAYIQSGVLKTISLEYRRSVEDVFAKEEGIQQAIGRLCYDHKVVDEKEPIL